MKKIKFITFILILASTMGFAQGPPPPPPPGLPIDGGVFILAVVGLYFGIKKLEK